ncbi:MAG: tetratricopeptide repeat protein, partial [Bacteroidota bacterium]
IWAKMNKIASPNANFIQLNYAISRPDPEEGLEELLKLRAEMDRLKREAGFIDNILGYMFAETGDLDNAKAHFDKYLEKYPDGYNAYDSMAEYYMMAEEYDNSVTYYKKVLEMYPGSQNAIDKLAELKGLMSKDGDLFLITQETVNPEHMGDYWKWGTEYKTVADQTNFQTFWVSSSGGTFSYAANVGKTYEDMEAYEKKWEDWAESTPAIQEQFEKYQHTVANTQKALWRHLPELSYAPKGFSFEKAPTYARVHYAYAKYGKEDEMETILKEFVDMWKEKGISRPFRVFVNVFGEDADCIAIRSLYEDVSAWKAEEKEVMEKIGKETLMEMRMKWMDNLRKFEDKEQFLHEELTHIKSPEVASVE